MGETAAGVAAIGPHERDRGHCDARSAEDEPAAVAVLQLASVTSTTTSRPMVSTTT